MIIDDPQSTEMNGPRGRTASRKCHITQALAITNRGVTLVWHTKVKSRGVIIDTLVIVPPVAGYEARWPPGCNLSG